MAVICAALLIVSGCRATQPQPAVDSPAVTTAPEPAGPLAASFTELARTIPAIVGIAVVPVGGSSVQTFGEWSTGVAWSTIKVPLAIAALRAEPPDAKNLAVKAITESDNAAAERLWSELGPSDQAALRVQAILRESGDISTRVESERLRPGFTAFGQTRWSLTLQARFAARLPCLPNTGGVIDLMRNLVGGQRWGLAAEGAAAKGGWGPGESAGYLVRQFAIVPAATGNVGVALAAEPRDGTFDAGVAALDQLARWLTAHTADLPGGRCPDQSS